jgi:hypothetical protein
MVSARCHRRSLPSSVVLSGLVVHLRGCLWCFVGPRWQAIKITLQCGSFSYAEIPKQYLHVMGVTGTFTTLSAAERDVLAMYGIVNHTLVPSVYGAHQLAFNSATTKYVRDRQNARRSRGYLVHAPPCPHHDTT